MFWFIDLLMSWCYDFLPLRLNWLYLQTTDCSIYEAVGEPGEAVSGGVTAVYVGSQQADSVNRIEIVTDDFMYSRGDEQRVSITRSVISREEVPGSPQVTGCQEWSPSPCWEKWLEIPHRSYRQTVAEGGWCRAHSTVQSVIEPQGNVFTCCRRERSQPSDKLTIEINSEQPGPCSGTNTNNSFDPDTLERELDKKIEKHKSSPTLATG